MSEVYWLGPCPAEEDAAQSTDPDFHAKNRAECLAYITAIKRVCGEPPDGATLRIRSEPHDFGSYREVTVEFDPRNPEALAYAMKCDEAAPTTWEQAQMTAPVARGVGR